MSSDLCARISPVEECYLGFALDDSQKIGYNIYGWLKYSDMTNDDAAVSHL